MKIFCDVRCLKKISILYTCVLYEKNMKIFMKKFNNFLINSLNKTLNLTYQRRRLNKRTDSVIKYD